MTQAEVTINITVDGDQIMVEQTPPGPVDRETRIVWICEQGYPFAVQFGWDSPLEEMMYKNEPKSSIAEGVIMSDAAYGQFKYFVAVCVNEQMLTLDPEIIVRRRRG